MGDNSRNVVYDTWNARRNNPPIVKEITRRRTAFGGKFNVDKMGLPMDIATDLDFIVRVVEGDKPTGFFRRLRRLT